jgi:hypothetical protein
MSRLGLLVQSIFHLSVASDDNADERKCSGASSINAVERGNQETALVDPLVGGSRTSSKGAMSAKKRSISTSGNFHMPSESIKNLQ